MAGQGDVAASVQRLGQAEVGDVEGYKMFLDARLGQAGDQMAQF